jgi:hypothetical protein
VAGGPGAGTAPPLPLQLLSVVGARLLLLLLLVLSVVMYGGGGR